MLHYAAQLLMVCLNCECVSSLIISLKLIFQVLTQYTCTFIIKRCLQKTSINLTSLITFNLRVQSKVRVFTRDNNITKLVQHGRELRTTHVLVVHNLLQVMFTVHIRQQPATSRTFKILVVCPRCEIKLGIRVGVRVGAQTCLRKSARSSAL